MLHIRCTIALPIVCAALTACQTPHGPRVVSLQQSVGAFPSGWLLAPHTTNPAALEVGTSGAGFYIKFSNVEAPLALVRDLPLSQPDRRHVTVTLRARAQHNSAPVFHASLLSRTDPDVPAYEDVVTTHTMSEQWTTFRLAANVPRSVYAPRLAVGVSGTGQVLVEIESIEVDATSEARLAKWQIERLAVLGRALALVRYFHPADDSVNANWDSFTATAAAKIISSNPNQPLHSTLANIFSTIAPTTRFYQAESGSQRESLQRVNGRSDLHLARRVHVGLGAKAPTLYYSFRTGVREESRAPNIVYFKRVLLPTSSTCTKFSARVQLVSYTDNITLTLWTRLEMANSDDEVREQKIESSNATTAAIDLSKHSTVRAVSIGIRASGNGSAVLRDLTAGCDLKERDVISSPESFSIEGDAPMFYEATVQPCSGTNCISIRRRPFEKEFSASRDLHEEELGLGIRIQVPLALWTDGQQTVPVRPDRTTVITGVSLSEAAGRVAAVLSEWGVIRYFYAGLADVQVDAYALLHSYIERAASADATSTIDVLRELAGRIRDAHVSIKHAADNKTSRLPFAFRWIDGKLIVRGTVDAESTVKLGDEVVSIDGVPSHVLFDEARKFVAQSTSGWSEFAAATRLATGRDGELKALRIRSGGSAKDVVIPVSTPRATKIRDGYRPATGISLRPNVLYVDLDTLTEAQWIEMLPALSSATGIIFDLRGYLTNTTFTVLSHLAQGPVRSPVWTVPVRVSPRDSEVSFQEWYWTIYPAAPHLKGRAIFLVDGRGMSAVETALQIVEAYKLGTIVGETSGGSNGNANEVDLPGGFAFRFTGMRVVGPTGKLVQGKGVQPAIVVHPTAAGIAAGRDELLEAALSLL